MSYKHHHRTAVEDKEFSGIYFSFPSKNGFLIVSCRQGATFARISDGLSSEVKLEAAETWVYLIPENAELIEKLYMQGEKAFYGEPSPEDKKENALALIGAIKALDPRYVGFAETETEFKYWNRVRSDFNWETITLVCDKDKKWGQVFRCSPKTARSIDLKTGEETLIGVTETEND